MRILGIDPGYDRCGICVIDNKTRPEKLIFSDCIEAKKTTDLFDRFKIVSEAIRSAINLYQPDVMALEKLFFEKNKKTAIEVAQLRGAVMLIAAEHDLKLFEYTPAQIKVAVTGYGRATKKDIILMVPKLITFNKPNALDDEYDAIATALTCSASENFSL